MGPGSLKGTLPEELQALDAATVLHLEGVNFHGTLPSKWSSNGFGSLQELYLGDNDLTGTLPSEWGSSDRWARPCMLVLVSALVFRDGSDDGLLPHSLLLISCVHAVSTLLGCAARPPRSHVKLSAGLQPAAPWRRWQQLTTLTAYSNSLTGSLPESWGANGAFPKLRTLVLRGNPGITGPQLTPRAP